jgi:hypothetical protein
MTVMIDEIPPYQGVDIALGRNHEVTKPPVAGWAITHPVLGAEMFESEEEADARISEIASSDVKRPLQTSKFRAWIHYQEAFPHLGGMSSRKHWSPR